MADIGASEQTSSPNGTSKFIILPPRGLRDPIMAQMDLSAPVAPAAHLLGMAKKTLGPPPSMRILHSLHEDGAKLLETTHDAAQQLRSTLPGLRIIPVVYYQRAARPRHAVQQTVQAAAATGTVARIRTVDAATGKPVAGVHLVAFTDFAARAGVEGNSDANGVIDLPGIKGNARFQRIYAYAPAGYWGRFLRDVTLVNAAPIRFTPLDLQTPDLLRDLYGAPPQAAGKGVTVGIIDSGVDVTHPDLAVAKAVNMVTDENDPTSVATAGPHGTHVAGIVAARGRLPHGLSGIAPDTRLHSYRVFPLLGEEGASNYDILRAIDQAVADGCDLINMSLGGGTPDSGVADGITDAFAAGTVCIVATGNDGRKAVTFPASASPSQAISAMGRVGTFPTDSIDAADVAPPRGTVDPNEFVAEFSNIGHEVDFVGPGVAIISTVPGGYEAMSGTSMACPAITGITARKLSMNAAILNAPRAFARAQAIVAMMAGSAKPRGFGAIYEGNGLVV